MKFINPYWSTKLKISALQRYILIHSYIYYELNDSLIDDKMFDVNSRQLVQMQREDSEGAEQSDYWYVFYDFDGSTGFDLFHRLNEDDKKQIIKLAHIVLALYVRK